MLTTVLVIVLILFLIGGLGPWWGPTPFYGFGYGGGGLVGLILIVLLILALTGRL